MRHGEEHHLLELANPLMCHGKAYNAIICGAMSFTLESVGKPASLSSLSSGVPRVSARLRSFKRARPLSAFHTLRHRRGESLYSAAIRNLAQEEQIVGF